MAKSKKKTHAIIEMKWKKKLGYVHIRECENK